METQHDEDVPISFPDWGSVVYPVGEKVVQVGADHKDDSIRYAQYMRRGYISGLRDALPDRKM